MYPHRAYLLVFLVLALGGLLGGACNPTLAPLRVAPECPEMPFRAAEVYASEPGDLLISDFETGTYDLAKVGHRDGSWIFGEESNTGAAAVAVVATECTARGKYAGHFAGGGFKDWGANWTANFHPYNSSNSPVPYDARAYGGISFFAAFGAANLAPFPVPIGIATMDTAWNSPVCTPTKDNPNASCTDHYMTTFVPTRDWQRFVLRFEDMNQAGTGAPQTDMKRDQFVGLVIWPKQQFDLWIDDVRFEP